MNTNLRTETEQVIFQSGVGGYREYRIPGILPLKDGALLLACESRAENKGDWGDIDIAIWRRGKRRRAGAGAVHRPIAPAARWFHAHVQQPRAGAGRAECAFAVPFELRAGVHPLQRGWRAHLGRSAGNHRGLPGVPLRLERVRHGPRPRHRHARWAAGGRHLAGKRGSGRRRAHAQALAVRGGLRL